MTPAEGVDVVVREGGWPSVERDVLSLADRFHWLLPVGFYYKVGLRPRWLWPRVEPFVRKLAGRASIDIGAEPVDREKRHLHADVLVIGAGVAGLAAAIAGAEADLTVVLCDEARPGTRVAPGPVRKRIEELADQVRRDSRIVVLEEAAAVGVYEGPLVPVNAADRLHLVHPGRVVVATGAVEAHDTFPGSDLPGVWLGRAAAQMALVHRVPIGGKVVVVGAHREVDELVEGLRAAGTDVVAPGDVRIGRACGSRAVTGVVLTDAGFVECDAVVLARGFCPRDSLLRQGAGLPVRGAGQVVLPNCSPEEAEQDGRHSVLGAGLSVGRIGLPDPPGPGFVCLCEDVSTNDLDRAWREGYCSTELLKRYTTATMGPCRGALCHAPLRAFVAARVGDGASGAAAMTARAPAREITVEEVAAGERAEMHHRTALHDRHIALGATMEPAGAWRRPERYGDVAEEYWAVRRGVSIMDVGTLGKFLIGGPDAAEFLERLYPCRVRDIDSGRIRYALLLGTHGYVIDDGLICSLEGGRFYLTFTSGGAEQAEAHLRDWADTWSLDVRIVNQTSALGAINVAGPHARALLSMLSSESFDRASFPYLRHRDVVVAGVPCRAIRLGFVGELSYELHHPSSWSVQLWDALARAGAEYGLKPHGLEALRLLRLEKGHVIVSQDTDYDTTPAKLGMDWAVKLDKPFFVGRTALRRISEFPLHRRLASFRFEGDAPPEGTPLSVGDRLVGHLTSSRFSPALGYGVALGWARRVDGAFPDVVDANGQRGVVESGPFYDPEGARVRA